MPFPFEIARYNKQNDMFVIDSYQYKNDYFPFVKFEDVQIKFKDNKLSYIYYGKITDKQGKVLSPVFVSFSNWDIQTVVF